MPSRCPACQAEVPEAASRCEACGNALVSVPPLPPVPWVVAVGVGVFVAAALAITIAVATPKPPDHPSAAYSAAFADMRWIPPPAPPSASAIEVEVAGPEIEGMDPEETVAVLHKHDDAVRACAKPAASAESEVEPTGGMRVRIQVRVDGTVQDVEILESDADDERVSACVQKVIRKIRFKRPSQPATIVTAWSFAAPTSSAD